MRMWSVNCIDGGININFSQPNDIYFLSSSNLLFDNILMCKVSPRIVIEIRILHNNIDLYFKTPLKEKEAYKDDRFVTNI